MKRMLAAATAILALAGCLEAVAAEPPYMDDRSDPEAVVRSLYNAINRHEYARAWSYFGEAKPAADFDAFVKGYEGTESVEIETGAASEEGAAGSVYFNLPVAIHSTAKDGKEQVFAGCYTLRRVNADIQEPPFNPLHIDKGELKPADGDLASALPESCGEGPPPPKKDAVLEQVKQAFAAAYSNRCDKQAPDGEATGEPTAYTIRYEAAGQNPEGQQREVRLFRFLCTAGAYNQSFVFYVSDDQGGMRQLQFATPELDIHYANNDPDGKVEALNTIGYRTEDRLDNAEYDAATFTLRSHSLWRGAGDASSSAIYLFRNGHFSLVQYDVDASYDGKVNQQTVLDYNIAP